MIQMYSFSSHWTNHVNFLNRQFMNSYTAELPSRCHKDIINALKQDDVITVDKLYTFLSTVDASQRISREDVVTIVSELRDDREKGLVISPKTLLSIF
jgi:hypothetical protein